VLIERGVIRFLYGRPLETLLATWGVSLILQQAVRTIFGPTNREVGAPSFMSGAFDVGRPDHHLQPPVDRRLHARRSSPAAARFCCASRRSACRCAR
jgi:branched-subunit amino acid ABC-type transport system permease component